MDIIVEGVRAGAVPVPAAETAAGGAGGAAAPGKYRDAAAIKRLLQNKETINVTDMIEELSKEPREVMALILEILSIRDPVSFRIAIEEALTGDNITHKDSVAESLLLTNLPPEKVFNILREPSKEGSTVYNSLSDETKKEVGKYMEKNASKIVEIMSDRTKPEVSIDTAIVSRS